MRRRLKTISIPIWACCYCGHGGMNALTCPQCIGCGNVRCGNCHTEMHKVRGGRDSTKGGIVPTPRPASSSYTTAPARAVDDIESPTRAPTVEARDRDSVDSAIGNETPIQAHQTADQISQSPDHRVGSQPQDLMRDPLDVKRLPNHQEETPAVIFPRTPNAKATVNAVPSVAPAADPGPVGAFAYSIMELEGLEHLWPQLVERYQPKPKCIQIIEVLLKRYTKDVALAAKEVSASNNLKSESQLCLTAATRFIRESRLQIAYKIWETLAKETKDLEVNIAVDHESIIEVSQSALEHDQTWLNEHLVYETIQWTLCDKGPIRSLQANMKLLISILNPMDTNSIYRISRSINTFVANAFSSLREPAPSPGHTRLRYKCRCGRKLYDDFKEAQPDELTNLQNLLASYFGGHPVTLEPGDFEPSTATGNSQPDGIMSGLISFWRNMLKPRRREVRLPWTSQHARDMELRTCSMATVNGQTNHVFLLLCFPLTQWGKKLDQIETCSVQSDQQLFMSLRQRYALACRSRRWLSFARLRRVTSLDFVKFELYKNELVGIHDSPSVPDREGVEQAKKNYSYDPLPAQDPPIPKNLLMHLFQHPEDANVDPIMYRRIPKKLRDKLQACPVKGSAVGWGVHFTEGVDRVVLFYFGSAGFFVALVLAVAWAIARDDIQSGFAMGTFLVGYVVFCLAIAQSEVQLGM